MLPPRAFGASPQGAQPAAGQSPIRGGLQDAPEAPSALPPLGAPPAAGRSPIRGGTLDFCVGRAI